MKKVKIVEFTGPSCGVCKMIAGVVQKTVSMFPDSVEYEEVCADSDENMKRAAAAGVKSVPVFVFYDENGVEVDRHMGGVSLVTLKGLIQKHLD